MKEHDALDEATQEEQTKANHNEGNLLSNMCRFLALASGMEITGDSTIDGSMTIMQLQHKITEFEWQLKIAHDSEITLKAENSSLKDRLSKLNNKIEELQDEIESLRLVEEENERLTQEVQRLASPIGRLGEVATAVANPLFDKFMSNLFGPGQNKALQ